ncbi:MAG: ferrous iron transporter B [Elusimicrobiales bacterium]|nr:ferrous iron transporter B [Elusimicrobiales bacterium]
MKIILVGNPNVGKSIVFSYLTGYTAISSNYPGTTVDILKGKTKFSSFEYEIIDIPGCYSLEGESVAEKVASQIINSKDYDFIFNVVDANNLERNLFLTLELMELKKPMIIIMTKTDIAKNKGIDIDYKKLSEILNIKIFPVIATVGVGFDNIKNQIEDIFSNKTTLENYLNIPKDPLEKWKLIGDISHKVQKITHKHPSMLEKLEEITTTPSTAIPFAFLVVFVSFYLIRFIGESLITYFLDPLFNNYYMPLVEKFSSYFRYGFLKNVIFSNNINPLEGFSVLTTGLYIPFVVVLPYVFSFYLVLTILEDIGYLPRLAVILDRFSHKIGLHGYGTIPMIMGMGCKVPGIFSLRILETEREKIIAASLLFLISPCIPQTAMIFSLLAKYHFIYTFLLFAYIVLVGLIASFVLNKILRGDSSDLFIEIPSYHIPVLKNIFLKLKIRIIQFILEAVPFVIFGIFIINILSILNIIDFLSKIFSVLANIFNLPSKTSSVFMVGFLKKDVAISLLIPFNLSLKEILVSSFFLVTYLPCLASIFVLLKELGKRMTLYIIFFNLLMSLFFTKIFWIMLSFII